MVRKFTKWEVLFPYLHDYRRSLILADFERELGKPHQTLKRYVEKLVDENVLKVEGEGKHRKYRLNEECYLIFHYLSIAEKLRTDEFIESETLVKRLYEETTPFMSDMKILVFGSYAAKREGEDIDMLLVGEEDEDMNRVLDKFGETYKPVHKVHVSGKKELHGRFKKELHKKHIIFNGTDYFVRLFGDMYGEFGMV